MTPMMEQYFEIKNQYKDYLLFYRLGDFYEMFFDDAITGSRELGLTLTGRDCGEKERAPMCGVPFHSAEQHIGSLIEKGYKVAICEQTEDPSQAKGLVKREVIRVITPGTLIEADLLQEGRNNFLCSLYFGEQEIGMCFADVSTATVHATSFSREDDFLIKIKNELGTYMPREVITNLGRVYIPEITEFILGHDAVLSDNQAQRFEFSYAAELAKKQFSVSLREGDLYNRPLMCAVGAMTDYIADMQKSDISYINELTVYINGQYLEMDINTRRNLELVQTMRTKDKKGSLLWVLDKTKTALGARMLRQWVEHPLLNLSQIEHRQGAVAELVSDYMMREEIGELLSQVLDLERLVTRIVYGSANARDLRAVANTANILPELKQILLRCNSSRIMKLCQNLDTLDDIRDMVNAAICEAPPALTREGGMIVDGYNADLDYLRSVSHDGKKWIEKLEEDERQSTGIKTLRTGYNKVFGYYIEVTKSLVSNVPERYIRKQTLSNCERYITQELKELETTILSSSEKIVALEYELFQSIRAFVADRSSRIQKVAACLAEIDAYLSLATVAAKNKYICPTVDMSDKITVKDGRHPVVEQFVKDTYFVPNDVTLDTAVNRIMLITGPNMAGKSTYMRQVALITVMAQIGSFVPASEAQVGIVDKVFTRVGASDDLASGQSTFMLEMTECAYILKNATNKSLIIYDEVGRGTSTFDGMSIAKAIIEYTNSKKIGAKTLFATHYHELTSMEDEFDGIVNYNIAAKKRGDNITFLRKIVRGSTDDSYGIEVAKLAGVPNEIIRRAKEVLASVEQTAKMLSLSDSTKDLPKKDDTLITFDDFVNEQVIEELKAVDVNTLSPYEAMTFLFNMQKRLK